MLHDLLKGFSFFIAYYIALIVIILCVRLLLNPPGEYLRKLMHTGCFLSILVLTNAFDQWFLAATASILFALLVYPLLALFEKYPRYTLLFSQRRKGEVKTSLVLVFLMMAAMITLFWGLLGEAWRYIGIVAILAWGFGDAAAALVGKRFGRHQVESRLVENAKTWEGSLAMYIVSACAIFLSLLIYTELPWFLCMAVSMIVAVASALAELLSHKGMDTINVPFTTALPLFGLVHLLMLHGI